MTVHDACEQAYKNGYEAGKKAGAPTWIPMTDRLPTAADTSKDREVLCCTEVNQYVDAWHLETVLENPEWLSFWMPMPKPPKEAEA